MEINQITIKKEIAISQIAILTEYINSLIKLKEKLEKELDKLEKLPKIIKKR